MKRWPPARRPMRTSRPRAERLHMISVAASRGRTRASLISLSDRGQAAVDGENLTADVLARVAGEEKGGSLQVVLIAEAPQRCPLRQLVGADLFDGAPG